MSVEGRRRNEREGWNLRVHELGPGFTTVVTEDIVVGGFQADVVLLEVLRKKGKRTKGSARRRREKEGRVDRGRDSQSTARPFR